MSIRIIREAEVRAILPVDRCVALMDETMRAVSAGRAVLPLRSVMAMPGGGALGNMPGCLADPACFGVKLVSLFPGDGGRHPSHHGVVLLFEPEHGRIEAIVDASAITAIRTAAVSGLATRLLARADAGDLALLGVGTQARSHLRAMLAVRPLRRIRVWARDGAKARAFAESEGATHGVAIEPAASVEAAVAGADIICTLTKARAPILSGGWVAPGAHLNIVGSSVVTAAEIDVALVARARFFVDYRPSAEAEAGEYRMALAAGAIGPDHIVGEIGAVASGACAGRIAPEDVTLYKSLGVAAQDLAAAYFVLDQARRRNIGVEVPY
ncbi:ornithine cyclodeaminase family protein [Sphingomonas flavalba]|uniref:ornithine cyclodeaminase family protein n=1 Tax=Sphingomonas flavalba TaxID=2559804 RepID=UPI0019D0C9AA|nr:ornithine cyclodeaminase family protein [Sphingomonas flavalba]